MKALHESSLGGIGCAGVIRTVTMFDVLDDDEDDADLGAGAASPPNSFAQEILPNDRAWWFISVHSPSTPPAQKFPTTQFICIVDRSIAR